MARIIDVTKLERIKDAVIQMIVSNNLGGSTISKIAHKAGVAEGYLYRFYKSKSDLINDLLYSNINELANNLEGLLNDQYSVSDIFEQLIRTFFNLANNHPERIKFLYMLMTDYSFRIQENQKERIFNLCKRIKEKGLDSHELRIDVDEEEIYLIGVTYPIQFINHRLKSFFYRNELGEPEIQKVLRTCNKLIQSTPI